MGSLIQLQGYVAVVLGVVLFAMEIFAFVDCLRQRADAFPAAGKQTKVIWLALTGAAAVIGFLSVLNPLQIFGLLAVVAAGVYLAGVRPALRQVIGRAKDNNPSGPYGPW